MMSGGDLFKLQRILGHKSTELTQRYSHLSPSAFQGDLDRFSGMTLRKDAEVLPMVGAGRVKGRAA
jgi:hypothetical protein